MAFSFQSHQPFPLPGAQWHLREPETRKDRFLNGVHYVDWALGEFIAIAKDGGYYDDTLFVILADQTSGFQETEEVVERHWVPALLLGPGIPKGVSDDRVASQMDLIPTLLDYFGWNDEHASLGTSLLGDGERAALLKNGESMLRVGANAWVMHDLRRRIAGAGPAHAQASLEQALLAEVQVVSRLLSTNRVYSGPILRQPGG